MALSMARPSQDPKIGIRHLRQRTPRALLRLKGTLVTLPIGDDFATVKIGGRAGIASREGALQSEGASRRC